MTGKRREARDGGSRPWMMPLVALACGLGCSASPQLVDQDPARGYALYRAGRLSGWGLEQLCNQGVEELLVLDGGAAERECRMLPDLCPGMRVRYSYAQDAKQPMSREFLKAFDLWIEESRGHGRKLAFRCRHGWHRAGRLTAYYRIRFNGVSVREAIDEMQGAGHFMWRHPQLVPQVEALGELVAAGTCKGGVEVCPQPGDPKAEGLAADGSFPVDACGGHADREVGR